MCFSCHYKTDKEQEIRVELVGEKGNQLGPPEPCASLSNEQTALKKDTHARTHEMCTRKVH